MVTTIGKFHRELDDSLALIQASISYKAQMAENRIEGMAWDGAVDQVERMLFWERDNFPVEGYWLN